VLGGLTAIVLLIVRVVPAMRDSIGKVLGSVDRFSLGEFYYALAVAILAPLAWSRPMLFVIPVLVLVLADAVAALVGVRYGSLKFVSEQSPKSIEGSIAFFLVAFLSVHLPLLLGTSVGRLECVLIALIIALLAMLFEAISWNGLDNLVLPLTVYVLLLLYEPMTVHQLWPRVMVTVVLVGFALLFRRRTTMDDAALIACALFAYALLMVGGPVALLAPLTVFLAQVALFPRPGQRRGTNVEAIAAIASTPLVCVVLMAQTGSRWPLVPLAVAMAAHWSFICISYAHTDARGRLRPWTIPCAVVSAAAFVMLPTLIVLAIVRPTFGFISSVTGWLASVGGLIGVSLAFTWLRRRLYEPVVHPTLIHLSGGVLAAVAAAIAGVLAWFCATSPITLKPL
jgi:phytol kinase